jgi:hypothetical protein
MELSIRMGNDSRLGYSILYNRLSSLFQTMKHTVKYTVWLKDRGNIKKFLQLSRLLRIRTITREGYQEFLSGIVKKYGTIV